MATLAIVRFGKKHSPLFSGPVLEVGSKTQPGYEQFSPREIHLQGGATDWLGVDIEEGAGVDRVFDLCRCGGAEQLGEGHFGTVHCHCVMEHVPDIFVMARNIERVLRPGGVLYLSVPFAWKLHRIPLDLWRFTPQGVDYLFPHIEFRSEHCGVSTRHPERFYAIDQFPELKLGSELAGHGFFLSSAVQLLRKLGLDRGLFWGQRALLVECCLMMVGRKKEAPVYTFLEPRLLPGGASGPP